MARTIDALAARELLTEVLVIAEAGYRNNAEIDISAAIKHGIDRLFTSTTQAYREALVGCLVARCLDQQINIRHPATETSHDAFSGRSLADNVITPFFQDHAIPVSKSPYLSSLRGGARFEPGGEPRIQRDQDGFDALVSVVSRLAEASEADARLHLTYLLQRFVVLREEAKIELQRIAKPNLRQLERLISGLLAAKSGGRLPALVATAMFQTMSECHGLKWNVVFQGINVADAASGAVGDIAISRDGEVILAVEVTERTIDKGRVTAVFEHKVTPNGLDDYLFITTKPPDAAAITTAYQYTAVGHEMNFVQLDAWALNNLASIGPRCRSIFQAKMLDLLDVQNADLKIIWNRQMASALAGS